jgi:hypothetical protein
MTDVGRMRVASEVLGDLAIVEIGRGRAGWGEGGAVRVGAQGVTKNTS